jgi:hypothetical protein
MDDNVVKVGADKLLSFVSYLDRLIILQLPSKDVYLRISVNFL